MNHSSLTPALLSTARSLESVYKRPKNVLQFHWKPFVFYFSILCSLLGSIQPLFATNVTFRIVNQNGDLIPSSLFSLLPYGDIAENTALSATAGSYTIRIYPGIQNRQQGDLLFREESILIEGATQNIDFVWKTAPFQPNLVDQNNNAIPNSFFGWSYSDRAPVFYSDAGTTVNLPVTEDPNTSTIMGYLATGYQLNLHPGINNKTQPTDLLFRIDNPIELTTAGVIANPVWKTAPFQLNIVDQNNIPILNSFLGWVWRESAPFMFSDAGVTLTLPVTEDASQTEIRGYLVNGYELSLYPGINDKRQILDFFRTELPIELTSAGVSVAKIWKTVSGKLYVVNANNQEVCGSTFSFPYGNGKSGSLIRLPVTDESIYPNMRGIYVNGYNFFSMQLSPNSNFVEHFTFEALYGNLLTPNFVTLGGSNYGLRFNLPTNQLADLDGDGICNENDNCPILSNPNQEDTNNNGIGDVCEYPTLTVHTGNCKTVFLGYTPTQCTSLTATASGGSGNYTYLWSNGATNATIQVCPTVSTTYTVTVSDNQNNHASHAVMVNVVDVRCGNNNNKVKVCHIPNGNPNHANALCISEHAVAAHLAHGDKLGECALTAPCSSMAKIVTPQMESVIDEALLIYPNPASDELNLQLSELSERITWIQIYNSLGKEVMRFNNETEIKQVIQLNINPLPNGFYLLKVVQKDKPDLVKQIIIQR